MGPVMGISSLQINSPGEGCIKNTILYLHNERATGTLTASFGDFIPDAELRLLVGIVVAAEFGDLKGRSVLDFLFCQEQGIKTLEFVPGVNSRIEQADDIKDESRLVKTTDVEGLLNSVSKDLDHCEARPFIYAPIPVDIGTASLDSLLRVFYAFDKHKLTLASVDMKNARENAPLPQCAIIKAALTQEIMSYRSPMVPLATFRDLYEQIQPLDAVEAENLTGFMRSLIPHPRANYMVLDRFYEFANAVETIANKRGREHGEEVRRIIYKIIAKAQGDMRTS
jgi:hypothetical protein